LSFAIMQRIICPLKVQDINNVPLGPDILLSF
jgi:hypothetical protein